MKSIDEGGKAILGFGEPGSLIEGSVLLEVSESSIRVRGQSFADAPSGTRRIINWVNVITFILVWLLFVNYLFLPWAREITIFHHLLKLEDIHKLSVAQWEGVPGSKSPGSLVTFEVWNLFIFGIELIFTMFLPLIPTLYVVTMFFTPIRRRFSVEKNVTIPFYKMNGGEIDLKNTSFKFSVANENNEKAETFRLKKITANMLKTLSEILPVEIERKE